MKLVEESGNKLTGLRGRKDALKKRLGASGTEKRKARRQMLIKIYGLLTRTPADESGLIPGTPFSKTGVERLMAALNERSKNTSGASGKAATALIKFLSDGDKSAENIAGASVEKLQWVAKMGGRFTSR